MQSSEARGTDPPSSGALIGAGSHKIAAVSLHNPRPWLQCADLRCSAALLALLLAAHAGAGDPSLDPLFLGLLLLLACAQALLFLLCEWRPALRALLRFLPAPSPAQAAFALVTPRGIPGGAQPLFCPLLTCSPAESFSALSSNSSDSSSNSSSSHSSSHSSSNSSSSSTFPLHFAFHNSLYMWRPDLGRFKKPSSPVSLPYLHYYAQGAALVHSSNHNSSNIPRNVQPGLSAESLRLAASTFPPNTLPVPLPSFRRLYREHAAAPFFVFQLFCCALWLLDEYWLYALLTAGMLCLFEALVVKQRLQHLGQLRAMVRQPHPVRAFRCGRWLSLPSSALFPGDLIALEPSADRLVPCDCLVVAGAAVVSEAMLTGESKPQRKDPISSSQYKDASCKDSSSLNRLCLKRDRDAHVISAGTSLLQASPLALLHAGQQQHAPPRECVLASVLRTGFETDQGRLLRTILFSTQPVTAHSPESGRFILVLLGFAALAVAHLLRQGLLAGRSPYKLFLEACFILTSVVPPELPLVLSIAVNASLRALALLGVFCTEPFRVPFGGRIDVACFDKTGTLTSDYLIFRGFAGLDPNDIQSLYHPSSSSSSSSSSLSLSTISSSTSSTISSSSSSSIIDMNYQNAELVVAGCQSLIRHLKSGALIGDPIEVAAVQATQWQLTKPESGPLLPARRGDDRKLQVVRRMPFSSTLKRMTAVASLLTRGQARFVVLCKGAPEVLRAFLDPLPAHYDAAHAHFALQGARVLAMACRALEDPALSLADVQAAPRERLERGMAFCGFLVFSCPMKPDSAPVLRAIHGASHRTVMITGDNVLTACHAARALAIVSRRLLVVRQSAEDPAAFLLADPADPAFQAPLSAASLDQLRPSCDLAISGADLQQLVQRRPEEWVRRLVNLVEVFARVTPQQKEYIIHALNRCGHHTLMCGDGTNDVGALKQAHVGLALVTGVTMHPSSPAEQHPDASPIVSPTTEKTASPTTEKTTSPTTEKTTSKPKHAAARPKGTAGSAPQSVLDDSSDRVIVQLGDASIAAPFSTRSTSIRPLLALLGQSRCTLVTTYQMFTILALNSLLQAYSLSVLYLAGVKFGDIQMTIPAFMITACFMTISMVKPLDSLSAEKPPGRLFSFRIFLSILTQFAIHMSSLLYLTDLASQFMPDQPIDLDGKFAPSLLNSTVFLMSIAMQATTFLTNFQGPPFMQSLLQSKPLLASLASTFGLVLLLATECVPNLNAFFELVAFPPEFKSKLLFVLFADLLLCYSSESIFRFLRRVLFRPKNVRADRF